MQKLFEDFITKLREEEHKLQIYKEELIQRQEELDEREDLLDDREDLLDDREKRLNIQKKDLDDLQQNLRKPKKTTYKKSTKIYHHGSNGYKLKNGWFYSNGKPVDNNTQKELKQIFKDAFKTAFDQPNSFFVDGYNFNSDSFDSDDNRPEGY